MPKDVRAQMIQGAAQLLARQGLQATSFKEVLDFTGAPRGSIYHHFPDGKDQMVAAAVDLAGEYLLTALEATDGSSADDVAAAFFGIWRAVLTTSDLGSGCAVLAVTVATDSSDLLAHTSSVFRSWTDRLAALLRAGGLSTKDARRMAVTLIASAEGAVVLSRAEQSLESFDLVADQIRRQVAALS